MEQSLSSVVRLVCNPSTRHTSNWSCSHTLSCPLNNRAPEGKYAVSIAQWSANNAITLCQTMADDFALLLLLLTEDTATDMARQTSRHRMVLWPEPQQLQTVHCE